MVSPTSVVNAAANVSRLRGREELASEVVDAPGAEPEPRDDALLASLDRLPRHQRAAIVLRYYLDLPLAHIAEVVGRPINTVKSDLRRGIAALAGEDAR